MSKSSPVGAFEAKTHFSRLLERVEGGEEIVITRRGKAVARLVPIEPDRVATGLAAAARLRSLAAAIDLEPFDWDEWRSYRNAGRR